MPDENDQEPPFVVHFDLEEGIAHLHDKDWFPEIHDINAWIAEKYGFDDLERHFQYLAEAAFIIQGYSGIRIEGRFVSVPSDLTPFKEAAAKFQKAMQKAEELSLALFDIQSDATADTLLFHFDKKRETNQLMKMIGNAMFTLVEIEKYEGQVGNRPVPDWLKEFCIHSQKYWKSEQGGGTRIIFEQARRTKITPWIEDVYVSLIKRLNVNVPLSRLKGVARNVPAYRTDQDPNTGDTR